MESDNFTQLKENIGRLDLASLNHILGYVLVLRDNVKVDEEKATLRSAISMYNEKNKFGRRIYTRENVCEEFGITRWVLDKAIKASTTKE